MDPKKGSRVKKIEVPTDTYTEIHLGMQKYRGGGKRGREERGRQRHKNRVRKPVGRKLYTQLRREWLKSLKGQREVMRRLLWTL